MPNNKISNLKNTIAALFTITAFVLLGLFAYTYRYIGNIESRYNKSQLELIQKMDTIARCIMKNNNNINSIKYEKNKDKKIKFIEYTDEDYSNALSLIY